MKADRISLEFVRFTFLCIAFIGSAFLSGYNATAAQLTQQSSDAFDRYAHALEARNNQEMARFENFLWVDSQPQAVKYQNYAKLRAGEMLVHNSHLCADSGCTSIRGSLIHDWIGVVFVPGVSIAQTLSVLQDYNDDAEFYAPQVIKSTLIRQSGNDFHVYLRLKQAEIVSVVFDTEYDIRYARLDGSHAYSNSRSTRIAEVENTGTSRERIDPPGDDHGFLWRLNSYWRFYQADGGVYIQCEAVSLTRDVPIGLGWLIGRFIEKIPADSLRSTLSETRAAVLSKFQHKQEKAQ